MATETEQYGSIDPFHSPPHNKQKQTKIFSSLSCIGISLFVLIIFIKSCGHTEQDTNSMNNIYVHVQNKNFELSDDREEVVVDELLGSDVEHLPFGSNEWMNFHYQLVAGNGYDINDESVKYVFKLYDTDEDDDDDEDDDVTDKNTAEISGLSCFSKYSFVNSGPSVGNNGFTLSMECDADSVMTGCVSFSLADMRSGEKPESISPHEQKCTSFALEEDYIGLGVRCCSPIDPSNQMEIGISELEPYPHSFAQTWSANAFCKDVGITDHNFYSSRKDYVIVGCTAWTGIDSAFKYIAAPSPGMAEKTMTKQMIGSQVTATKIGSVNNGMCSAHRGDEEGFISAQAIAGYIDSSSGQQLECRTLISQSATLSGSVWSVWMSTALCPRQYVNVDCNAFVYGHMDSCDTKIESDDKTYGGRFNSKNGCEAFGTSELIRAQSICCRIR